MKQEPVARFKFSGVEAAVWAFDEKGRNGGSYTKYSVTVSKSYRKRGENGREGDWETTNFLAPDEALVACRLMAQAFDFIQKEKESASAERRARGNGRNGRGNGANGGRNRQDEWQNQPQEDVPY